jgi:hypothetical protein
VIPQTLGALAAFLTLVAPGIAFELRRERRRARHQETAFREASRVALGSLVFTVASLLVLTGIQGLFALLGLHLLASPQAWLSSGDGYVREHLALIVVSVAVELALACALAIGFDFLLARRGREQASVRQWTAWTEALRLDRPADTRPWVHIFLESGSSFFGYVRSFTPSGPMGEREIVIEGESLTYQGKPLAGIEEFEKKVIGDTWHRVVIPGAKIAYLRVAYLHQETGELIRDPEHRLRPPKIAPERSRAATRTRTPLANAGSAEGSGEEGETTGDVAE